MSTRAAEMLQDDMEAKGPVKLSDVEAEQKQILTIAKKTGADVMGIDWRTDMAEARQILGDMPVQGNLDPIALYGPKESIQAKVRSIIEAAGPTGHVFNLGHGVLPTTPVEGVDAMMEAVKSWRW